MSSDKFEQRILSGEFFQPQERSSSPSRSVSTASPVNTDDELGSDLDAEEGDQDFSPPAPPDPSQQDLSLPQRSGANTGVKGVIKDQQHRKAVDRELFRRKVNATNQAMEKHSLQAQTIVEEDRDRKKAEKARENGGEVDEVRQRWLAARKAELAAGKDGKENNNDSRINRFGLREVGEEGFVGAVDRPGWVVVLVYEPDIPRCIPLLQSLLHIQTSLQSSSSNSTIPLLLRARATALSFSLLPPTTSTSITTEYQDQEDDDDEGYAREKSSRRADPDVLPTLLIYKDGELEKSCVRVDWEVGGGEGLEGLFRREGILPTSYTGRAQDLDIGDDDD